MYFVYRSKLYSYILLCFCIQVWAGNPAKFLRELKGEEGAFIPKSADSYSELAAAHAEANAKSFHNLTTVPEVKTEEKSPELTQAAQ